MEIKTKEQRIVETVESYLESIKHDTGFRHENISLRCMKSEAELIRKMSDATGKTIAEFVIESVVTNSARLYQNIFEPPIRRKSRKRSLMARKIDRPIKRRRSKNKPDGA